MTKSLRTSLQKRWRLTLGTFCCFVVLGTLHSLNGLAKTEDDGIVLSQPLAIAWRYQTDQTTDLTPAADTRTVFAPLGSGVLVALNAIDGKLLWKAEAGGEFSASPAIDDRTVYAASRYAESDQKRVHGTLRALSKSTGVTLWMRTLPAPLLGGLVVAENAVFAGSIDGRVYAFDKHT